LGSARWIDRLSAQSALRGTLAQTPATPRLELGAMDRSTFRSVSAARQPCPHRLPRFAFRSGAMDRSDFLLSQRCAATSVRAMTRPEAGGIEFAG